MCSYNQWLSGVGRFFRSSLSERITLHWRENVIYKTGGSILLFNSVLSLTVPMENVKWNSLYVAILGSG